MGEGERLSLNSNTEKGLTIRLFFRNCCYKQLLLRSHNINIHICYKIYFIFNEKQLEKTQNCDLLDA